MIDILYQSKQRLIGILIWTKSWYAKRSNRDGGLAAGICNYAMVR
jgi:hypothetical protein